MPAIPLIGLGISAYSAYKQAKQAGEAAKMQKELMGKQTALSGELSGFARGQTSLAQPALSKAMQHYMTLATGSRGAIGAELAPGIAGVTESSRGAERGINRSIAAGPSRDRAIADLYRQRAGQIGMMPFQAQQGGYAGLEKMGGEGMGRALDAYRGASNALSGASSTGKNYESANQDKWGAYNEMITSGTKAASGAYDWWKKSRSDGSS
jgi:hypothetical protein